jgi:acetyltransferase-like isoleucine patch superfamily enzyme
LLFFLLRTLKKVSNNQLCSLFLESLKEKIAASILVAYLFPIPLKSTIMKKKITVIIAFCLPSQLAGMVLNLLGHKIHSTAKIGFSFLSVNKLYMDKDARIGHFNIIIANKLLMREGAFMKKFNRVRGPINLLFRKYAALANGNNVYRGNSPITIGLATLKLGVLGQIVSKTMLDLTKSITIGDNSTVGGHGGQFWTHGFVHAQKGSGRIRVDGEIVIGNNVYVGSRCTFNPGVFVGDGISIGSNVCVAKSLKKSGMYVAQSLRWIPQDFDKICARLTKVENHQLENVYEKVI